MKLASVLWRIRADQHSVAMGSAITVVFNALSLAAYGIGSVLVNRQIGPEQAGQLTWFVTTTQMTSIFADLIGVYYSNLQMTASRAHNYPDAEVRTTVLVYAAALGLAVTSLLMFIPPLRAVVLPGYDGPRWTLLAVSGVVGAMLVNQIRGLFWSQSRFIWVGFIWFLRTFSYSAIAITGAYLLSWRTSRELALAHVAASWVCVAAAMVFLGASGFGRFRFAYLAACWRMGVRGTIQNALSLSFQRTDQYMIRRFLTWTDLGLYSVVVNLGEVLAQIPGCVGMVTFSDTARRIDRAAVANDVIRRALVVMAGIAMLGVCLWLTGEFVVGALYGPAFLPAAAILAVYLPGLVLQSGVLLANNHISARGYPAHQLVAAACAIVVNIAAGIILAPRFGLVGVAAAVGIAYFVWLLSLSFGVFKEAKTR